MFNIGPAELIVILLVALLIVGPKRLPEVGKSVGKALREIRRQTDEVRSSFDMTLDPGDDDDDDQVEPIRDVTGMPEPEPDEADAPTLEPASQGTEPVPAEARPARRRRRSKGATADEPGAGSLDAS